jgi:putative peptide zinc metalloprotease protein
LKSDQLLALKFRVGGGAQAALWRIAGVFVPMFRPLVILVALAAFVGLDALIIARDGLAQIVPSALAIVDQPVFFAAGAGVVLTSAAFHECGHVSACRYGGAKPEVMGFGLYLVCRRCTAR